MFVPYRPYYPRPDVIFQLDTEEYLGGWPD